MRSTSFISEHTAEYVLVPRVVEILSRSYAVAVPFYYWASREGASLSRAVGPRSEIRLVSVYPRRPKFTEPGGEDITVRFNDLLFEAAAKSEPLGIPVFAGVPLASCLQELGGNTKCAWFRIPSSEAPPATTDIQLGLDGEVRSTDPQLVEGPITEEEFSERVQRLSRPMEWSEVRGVIKMTRQRDGGDSRFYSYTPFWFNSYKPFHVLLMSEPDSPVRSTSTVSTPVTKR